MAGVEATGGSIKAHTAHIALAQGRSSCWSSSRFESARLLGNSASRPWGVSGPTPAEAFAQKPSFTPENREALAELIQAKEQEITASIQRERQQRHPDQDPALNAAQRATVARTATRQALVELGYLQTRRNSNMSTQSTPCLSGN